DFPAVGRFRENARRRAVQAVRGSAPSGEGRTDHEAGARLRPRLKRTGRHFSSLRRQLRRQAFSRHHRAMKSAAKMPPISSTMKTVAVTEPSAYRTARSRSTRVAEFFGQRAPAIAIPVEERLASVGGAVGAIAFAQRVDARVRRANRTMRGVQQRPRALYTVPI